MCARKMERMTTGGEPRLVAFVQITGDVAKLHLFSNLRMEPLFAQWNGAGRPPMSPSLRRKGLSC